MLNKEKLYKISYRVYHNERLQPVLLNGKKQFPLYIQITYDRRSIYFKSYYFDLFSNPPFNNHVHLTSNQILALINKEEESLIDFIATKFSEQFSLDLFKEKYTYYSRELLSMMEDGFKDYLYTFFSDEGESLLANMIQAVGPYSPVPTLLQGLKSILKINLYNKMIKHAAFYAPPYLPLNDLAHKNSNLAILPVYKWEEQHKNKELVQILAESFPEYNIRDIEKYTRSLLQK